MAYVAFKIVVVDVSRTKLQEALPVIHSVLWRGCAFERRWGRVTVMRLAHRRVNEGGAERRQGYLFSAFPDMSPSVTRVSCQSRGQSPNGAAIVSLSTASAVVVFYCEGMASLS